jgi:hypothetical protein
MDAALAGLIGAGIGALAGIAGAMLTYVLQTRLEREKWLRDRRVEVYTNAIRYLIRVSNKRSILTAEGVTVLGQDAVKEWFDEISEARSWLTSLLIYCSQQEQPKLNAAIERLNKAVADFLTARGSPGDLIESAQATCLQVAESARKDVGSDHVPA